MQPRALLILFLIVLPLPSWMLARASITKGRFMAKPTPKIPHRMEIHGDVRTDDYFWLRERDTGPVLDFLKQENARTAEALAPVASLEAKLYREMRARVKEDDRSVPVFDTGYWYYWRYETGGEYPVHARKKDSLEAAEDIFLNENTEAKNQTYFDVGDVEITSDHRLMAYAVDTVGRRIYDVHFKDLSTGQMLPDKIEAITPNLVWAEDHRTLFYVRQDPETLRAHQLWRYELGGKSELIYEEKDTTYNVGVSASKTHRYIFLEISKRDSTEIRYLDANRPHAEFQTFLPRELHHEYSVEDGGDRFFILTNWQAANFRVMTAAPTARAKSEWHEVVPHDPKIFLEGLDVYDKYFVLSAREHGLPLLEIHPRVGQTSPRRLSFPDEVYEVDNQPLPEYHGTTLRFHYQSLVQPPSVYDEDVFTGARALKKTREVPGYDPKLYEVKRLWAKAKDGTQVPISLLTQKDRAPNGPALLYGYGSYGLSTDASFRSSVFSLVDRGFAYAIAHVRGGSEMGRAWYEQGRLVHKMNTFTDFIAAAETLIDQKLTTPEHLHIMGGSAGGLLMGATMNLRPDLFRGVVAAVPFVDVLTTMLDETIPLTTGEYNEWGDPRIKEQYGWMKKYSPYDNVEKKAYPNLLITTGYHDSQVQYWEPAKWLAKLREFKTDSNLLLMYTELEAGHSGASGRFEALKTLAKEYGFFLLLEGRHD